MDLTAIYLIALPTGLYLRAVRVLARRGYRVPVLQQVSWYAGVSLMGIALLSPLDSLGETDLVSAHMAQHLLIADLSAPLLVIGLRSPVYAFYLPRPLLVHLARLTWLRRAFRVLRRPYVAVPVWLAILYGWHFAFAFVGALEHPLVHVVQHLSFLFGALLVWWSVIEPKRRRTPGELWKVPYLIGARVGGMFLGMALILLRSPAYAAYYGDRPREHGLSPITDQQIAGGMMLGLDLFVMLFALAFFFYRSAQEHDRAERATVATG